MTTGTPRSGRQIILHRVGAFEQALRRHWMGEPGVLPRLMTVVTAPLSTLFGLGVRFRSALFDVGLRRSRPASIPVISVGNLSVGGTGKTPTTRWLVEELRSRGFKPAVVARGYGEDELALHRRWAPDVPVVADPDRVSGVEVAAARGADVAVLDDGFQHRRLHRDLDIVLMAADQPFPVRLLPRGPYREPLSALKRSDMTVVTAKSAASEERARRKADDLRRRRRAPRERLPEDGAPEGNAESEGLIDVLVFSPGPWQALDGSPADPPRGGIMAVASVAEPTGFSDLLQEHLGLEPHTDGSAAGVDLMAWPDHHPYTQDDLDTILEQADGRTVVTTEKDAVKLDPLLAHRNHREGLDPSMPAFRVLPIVARPGPRLRRHLDRLLKKIEGLGPASSGASDPSRAGSS